MSQQFKASWALKHSQTSSLKSAVKISDVRRAKLSKVNGIISTCVLKCIKLTLRQNAISWTVAQTYYQQRLNQERLKAYLAFNLSFDNCQISFLRWNLFDSFDLNLHEIQDFQQVFCLPTPAKRRASQRNEHVWWIYSLKSTHNLNEIIRHMRIFASFPVLNLMTKACVIAVKSCHSHLKTCSLQCKTISTESDSSAQNTHERWNCCACVTPAKHQIA